MNNSRAFYRLSRIRFNQPLKPFFSILAGITLMIAMSGCASPGGSQGIEPINQGSGSSRVSQCKSTDQRISSSSQCLQDDAACYQLSNGDWCTGERGNICPAGSIAVPDGAACPIGKRCFNVGESLRCTIS